jgi:hypothetical protein
MKYKGQQIRPIWQILLLIPCYLLYLVAAPFVRWMDGT